MVMRLTPNGRLVRAFVSAISTSSSSGVIAPQAITPKPPALEIAETRFRSLTQLIAPPMMATRQPRNAVPRDHSRSSSTRAAVTAMSEAAMSGGIEAIGGMQGAHRQLRVFRGNQHAHLYLAGGNHLDIDRLVRQGTKHRVRDTGMAAHAHPDHADLRHIRIREDLGEPDLLARLGERRLRPWEVRLADGEGHVGQAVGRNVLHNHIDVDVVLRQGAEYRGGDPRPVGYPPQRDL